MYQHTREQLRGIRHSYRYICTLSCLTLSRACFLVWIFNTQNTLPSLFVWIIHISLKVKITVVPVYHLLPLAAVNARNPAQGGSPSPNWRFLDPVPYITESICVANTGPVSNKPGSNPRRLSACSEAPSGASIGSGGITKSLRKYVNMRWE